MVHLLKIKLNAKEIDGVPVTGIPVGSRTELTDMQLGLGDQRLIMGRIQSKPSTYECC